MRVSLRRLRPRSSGQFAELCPVRTIASDRGLSSKVVVVTAFGCNCFQSAHWGGSAGSYSGLLRVLRGGCKRSDPRICRSAYCNTNRPDHRHGFVGVGAAATSDLRSAAMVDNSPSDDGLWKSHRVWESRCSIRTRSPTSNQPRRTAGPNVTVQADVGVEQFCVMPLQASHYGRSSCRYAPNRTNMIDAKRKTV